MTTASTTPAARALARQMLTTPARGALTLLNGTDLHPHGHWAALGIALGIETEVNRNIDLLTCDLSSGTAPIPHPLTAAMRKDGACSFVEWDTDQDKTGPDDDWEANAHYDRLPHGLRGRDTPSITAVARYFHNDQPSDGESPILLIDVAFARPYIGIIRTQNHDPNPLTRQAFTKATYEWLARDLATLAAMRPTEPTIVASDDQAPEWQSLINHAALVFP